MKKAILVFGAVLFAASCVNQPVPETTRTNEPVAPEAGADAVFVTVDSDGQIWIDNQVIDPEAIRSRIERLHSANPELPVVVRADQSSPTSAVVRVLDAAASQSSVESVSIVALEDF